MGVTVRSLDEVSPQPITASRNGVRALTTKFKNSVWLLGVHPTYHSLLSLNSTHLSTLSPPARCPELPLVPRKLVFNLIVPGPCTSCPFSLTSLSLLLHLATTIAPFRLRSSHLFRKPSEVPIRSGDHSEPTEHL